MRMKRTVKVVDKSESGYDFEYWGSLSPEERLRQYGVLLRNDIFNPITEYHRKALRTKFKIVKHA